MIASKSTIKLLPAVLNPSKSRTGLVVANGDSQKSSNRRKRFGKSANVFYCKYDIVRKCLSLKEFTPIEEDPVCLASPLIWMDSGVVMATVMALKPWQKINHFPGMSEICRKDTLARNLNRMRREFPKHFNFYPKTWWPPANIRDFYDHHQKKPGGIYIAKPVASSQGRGIFLFKNPEDPTISEMLDPRNYNQIIIQQYLSDPFLIDGTKFDFRIYVLVTSADPLEAMIYGEGLGRFATCKYEPPKSSNSGNVFMHLTNYSINKFNTEFDRNQDSGSKRLISAVMQTLREMGHNTDKLWADIKSAIIKTLLVVAPYLARNYHASTSSHRTGDFGIGQQKSANESIAAQQQTPAEKSQCFELLGFDVIIDRKLKPYILEVNHSPSLTCDADIDLAVKQGLLCDTLDVIKISSAPRARKHYMRLTKKLSTLRLTRAVTASITANNPQSKLQQRSKSSINDTDDSSDSTGDSSGNDDNQDCCSEMEDEDAGSDSSSECGEESSTGDEHGDGSQAKRITTSEMTLLSPCVGKYERLYPPVQPNPIYDQILAAAEQQIALESHHTKSTSSRLAHLDAKQKREEEERIRMEQIKQQMRERNHQLATLFQAKKLSSSAMRSKMQETSWVRRKSKFEQKMSSNRTLLSLSQIDLGSDLDFQRYK